MKTVYVVDGAKIANILADPMRNHFRFKAKMQRHSYTSRYRQWHLIKIKYARIKSVQYTIKYHLYKTEMVD